MVEAKPEVCPLNGVETESGRYTVGLPKDLIKEDKVSLDIFWLKDKSLEDSEDFPPHDELAQVIADDLQAACEQFVAIPENVKG